MLCVQYSFSNGMLCCFFFSCCFPISTFVCRHDIKPDPSDNPYLTDFVCENEEKKSETHCVCVGDERMEKKCIALSCVIVLHLDISIDPICMCANKKIIANHYNNFIFVLSVNQCQMYGIEIKGKIYFFSFFFFFCFFCFVSFQTKRFRACRSLFCGCCFNKTISCYSLLFYCCFPFDYIFYWSGAHRKEQQTVSQSSSQSANNKPKQTQSRNQPRPQW